MGTLLPVVPWAADAMLAAIRTDKKRNLFMVITDFRI
jgi:hypothetical protein